MKIYWLPLALMLLSSCVTTVNVDGRVPTPLVGKIPANVGVFYDEDFKNFQHREVLEAEGLWKINIGDQNFEFFQNLMNSMFESVTVLPSSDLEGFRAANPGVELDAIVIPRIEKYGFLTPNLSGLKFFSASIHYRIEMADKEGNQLTDWVVVGYGKEEGGAFSGNEALGAASMKAIRDGGARIAIGLPQEPGVASWAAAQKLRNAATKNSTTTQESDL